MTVDTARPQRKRTIQEHLEEGSGEENVDGGLRVQLEEDGDGSTMNWMDWNALWPMIHCERQSMDQATC